MSDTDFMDGPNFLGGELGIKMPCFLLFYAILFDEKFLSKVQLDSFILPEEWHWLT